jgi:hypothetical protein
MVEWITEHGEPHCPCGYDAMLKQVGCRDCPHENGFCSHSTACHPTPIDYLVDEDGHKLASVSLAPFSERRGSIVLHIFRNGGSTFFSDERVAKEYCELKVNKER